MVPVHCGFCIKDFQCTWNKEQVIPFCSDLHSFLICLRQSFCLPDISEDWTEGLDEAAKIDGCGGFEAVR